MSAVFYILSGYHYVKEAVQSAESVRRHMPGVESYLFHTPDIWPRGAVFDHIVPLPTRCHNYWYLDSLRYLMLALPQLPERLLWLDSDTYCCMPFGEMFEMLGRFDMIAAHAPGRKTGPTVHPIPDCFPELNIGVMGIYNKAGFQEFAARWYAKYAKYQHVYEDNDQNSLRETLWEQCEDNHLIDCFQFYVMPPEWNLRLVSPKGYFIRDRVRFLHGRHPDMNALAEGANRKGGMRVWKPR